MTSGTEQAAGRLWYRQPARSFDEALPVGNGRLGAMVYGGVPEERLSLNEETFWSGGPIDHTNPEARAQLPTVRRLLLDGHFAEAQALADTSLVGRPRRLAAYQPLGELGWCFVDRPRDIPPGYRRELDLRHGVVRSGWEIDGARYTTTVLASRPHQVLAVRLVVEPSRPLVVELALASRFAVSQEFLEGNCLALHGRWRDTAPADAGDTVGSRATWRQPGLGFEIRVRILATSLDASSGPDGPVVRASDLRQIVLLVDAATTYEDPDPGAVCAGRLARAATKSWEELAGRHRVDQAERFERCRLELGNPGGAAVATPVPTDERLHHLRSGGSDPGLVALVFDYGRYLLAASSGRLPPTLQGIWNEDPEPPWGSKFTLNINLEMNEWGVDVANLAEHFESFARLVESLVASGQHSAQALYGCRGFVVHHNTDLWRASVPVDSARSGIWPLGAAWLCNQLVDHARFSGQPQDLERAYGPVREAALFLADFLVETDDGHLVTCPSSSPENSFVSPEGSPVELCAQPTMDTWLVRECFENTIELAATLGRDRELADRLRHLLTRLPEVRIGRHGQLCEWSEDREEAEPGHRHLSHLYGLYPGSAITPTSTPELAGAARVALERRLAAQQGSQPVEWSKVWLVALWARLGLGDRAHQAVQDLLTGCLSDNLLSFHPPKHFQIDASLGIVGALAELLVQSHGDTLRLLPALPSAWPDGTVRGLRTRGGFEVDLHWRHGRAEQAEIRSARGSTCHLVGPPGQVVSHILDREGRAVPAEFHEGTGHLPTVVGGRYRVFFT